MMGTVMPPLYRIVTKSWLSGQSISSVSSSKNNPLDTRLWGWAKKGLWALTWKSNRKYSWIYATFFHINAKISYMYLKTKCNRVLIIILKNRKKNPEIIQGKEIVFFQYFFFENNAP